MAVSETQPPERRRRRLSVDQRRTELLRIGMELFSTRAYDEIWIEEIAERAGISRGLLYHYFPTKRDFYVAVTRLAAEETGELTAVDPALAPADQLRAGIDVFVRYAEDRPEGFLAAWRGAAAGDPEVRAIGQQARERHITRILTAVTQAPTAPYLLRLAIHGWISSAQEIIARWLEEREVPREAVTELLVRTLVAAISSAQALTSEAKTASPRQPRAANNRGQPGRRDARANKGAGDAAGKPSGSKQRRTSRKSAQSAGSAPTCGRLS